ncbi:MAG: cytochrome c3 family protein [Sterolibacterium sp.]|nr:cytochrome c3 family protein [Sterolibacterium sp.]
MRRCISFPHFKAVAVAGVLALIVLPVSLTVAPADAAVATTKHNLSVSGTGTVKATSENQICVFCHAPHNNYPSGQLWNRRVGTSYTPYTSSTRKSVAGQPNGASLLCLSCHDGTIALGEVRNRTTNISMTGGVTTLPAGNTNLGTNLSDDHPVSFVYDASLVAVRGELAAPTALAPPSKVRLDGSSQMQCTSCHNPHDNTNTKFLAIANTSSALCNVCHLKNYWSVSDHKNSTKTWNGAGTTPWPHTTGTTVAANACENCHRPHTAGGGPRLLNYAAEETNCMNCHNGNVAAKNIQTELNKTYGHKVATRTGVHDPAEAASVATAHVECQDCHNPHAVNATAGSVPGGSVAPTLPGSQVGVRGISISGTEVNPATTEYEICFRCHADGAANTPSPSFARVIAQNNKRLEFQTTNPSHHAVAGAGRSATVPSLLTGWTTASRVKCTDCHNNNTGRYSSGTPSAPTGTGPNGPHGSTYPNLLERQYVTTDNTAESAANYALCYKCHNRTSIIGTGTNSFKEHNKHIVGERAPCSVCHDPHGISSTQGTTLSNSRLLNFRTDVVTKSGTQAIRWERVGTTGGKCYMTCHGENHNGYSY